MKKIKDIAIIENGRFYYPSFCFTFYNNQKICFSTKKAFEILANLENGQDIHDSVKSLMIEYDLKKDDLIIAIKEGSILNDKLKNKKEIICTK